MSEQIRALLERIEKAEWPSTGLDAQIEQTLVPPFGGLPNLIAPPAFTSSVDSALALVERLLPGWHWQIGTIARVGMSAQFAEPVETHYGPGISHREDAKAATAPLAILCALLRAKLASADSEPAGPKLMAQM